MMRVLEFLVALLIVAGIGVIAGVASPGSGHVDRTLTVGKDLRQAYDVLNNFRRFSDYSGLRAQDRDIQYKLGGNSFGPGAEISWTSQKPKVGNGSLTITSSTPKFDEVDSATSEATVVWKLDNPWRGTDKHFTLDMQRKGSRGQLTDIKWSYDVQYGWNLISRFSNLYIHGDPDSFIQGSLGSLENLLAAVPNIDYAKLVPSIEQVQAQPVLLKSAMIERKNGIEALEEAVSKAVADLTAAAKELGVNVIGQRTVITTNFGDKTYSFDVALPIDTGTLTVNGATEQLTAATPPSLDSAAASSAAEAEDVAVASSAEAPAGGAVADDEVAGSRDRYGRLVIGNGVRATLTFGGPVLKGVWKGTVAGVPQIRDMLKAYAQTHGYRFDEVVYPSYDVMVTPGLRAPNGDYAIFPNFVIYLPLTDAPEQTPEQAAGMQPPTQEDAPAPASTAATPAGSASAEAPRTGE